MTLTKTESAAGWNEAVLRRYEKVPAGGGAFLQSWEWGEFQRAAGFEPVRLKAAGTEVQMLKRPLPFGKWYWYCPRGPIDAAALPELKRFASETVASFLRFEPFADPGAGVFPRRAVQPQRTMFLDLRKDPGDLMAAMHEKTRYNIRLAERKGVQVYPASGKKDSFEIFWELMKETAARDEFSAHGKDYYRLLLESLAGDVPTRDNNPRAQLVFAEHDGRVLAANLMIYFGGAATYLHGASSRAKREVMAPYLLHWKTIEQARAFGCRTYDFWGVSPMSRHDGRYEIKDASHAWAGVTRFKAGFGGEYAEYPGTFDLPISRFWYTLYRLASRK